MNQELWTYIQQVQQYIQTQDQRISRLEKIVKGQQKVIDELKNKPPIQVDKIEYKFDQLKVESLDGTLNIGLNPSDLQNIEDFAVENKGISTPPISPKQMGQGADELKGMMFRYMETELPKMIDETKEKLNLTLDEAYTEFIIADLKKQLPGRIDHYLKQTAFNNIPSEARGETQDKILNQIKQDIEQAVYAYLSNFPKE